MKITFELPDGVRLPRFIDATLAGDPVKVLQGTHEYRALTLSNGCILRVIAPKVPPVFKVEVRDLSLDAPFTGEFGDFPK